jgi:cation diffusion facilitator family transporter
MYSCSLSRAGRSKVSIISSAFRNEDLIDSSIINEIKLSLSSQMVLLHHILSSLAFIVISLDSSSSLRSFAPKIEFRFAQLQRHLPFSRALYMHGGHHHHHEHAEVPRVAAMASQPSFLPPMLTAATPGTAMATDSNHDHDHDHNHQLFNENNKLPTNIRILLTSLLIIIPSIVRRRVTRLDIGFFLLVLSSLTVLNSAKSIVNSWISKVRTLRNSLWKHTTPITRNYFFKNESAADRVTLLGIYINILLSVTKFIGGILCHSAVLVADAGHSLSDLFSDFITLWAVQVARLPADDDHPYGHGKFESIGSLFLSLTLLGAGLSVGSWSYDKLVQIIQKASIAAAVEIPTWPALVLAASSILSKEWLFRVTRRVGQLLNSQILIANAWHHRSDAFSSVLSLASIAFAMLLPQFVFVDAAAGILIAGMICFSGIEILFESIKQLTDTADNALIPEIANLSYSVEGVLGVSNIRTRSVGSGDVVDLTVYTDQKISASSSQAIGERLRWKILQAYPRVMEVTLKTRFIEPICPLLSQNLPSAADIEREIRSYLQHPSAQESYPGLQSIDRVMIHYTNTVEISAEVVIRVDSSLSFADASKLAESFRKKIVSSPNVVQAEVLVSLTSKTQPASSSNAELMTATGLPVTR